jgi:hypothetical protein
MTFIGVDKHYFSVVLLMILITNLKEHFPAKPIPILDDFDCFSTNFSMPRNFFALIPDLFHFYAT